MLLNKVFVKCVKQGVPDLSEFGDAYELGFGMGPDKPPTSAMVKKELQRKIVYHSSPQEVRIINHSKKEKKEIRARTQYL